MDPDGVACLTVAERYAKGDILRAINGYWSPWGCWLTALGIKSGFRPFTSVILVNTLGAVSFLVATNSIFIKLGLQSKLLWLFNVTLSLFLCFAVFYQSFDDLWECFFLLAALRLMLNPNFSNSFLLWLGIGFLGTLAYFSKSYAFPFFMLNVAVCSYFLVGTKNGQAMSIPSFIKGKRYLLWLKICVTSIAGMLLFALPWMYLLHTKYGIWTTSTAGSLNLSWYLVGHPHWKEGIKYLVPPVYPDSPYYWEDPYIANSVTPHFWNSFSLLGLQVLRVGLNLYKLLRSMVQISIVFPVISVILFRFLTNKQARKTNSPAFIIALSFVLFPLGYLLINFESRYLWYMLPLSLLAGGLFFQNHIFPKNNKKLNFLPYLFALSFLVYPLWQMFEMYNQGKEEYQLAQQLKKAGIQGSFTSNRHPRYMARLAFFSGNPYFYNAQPDLLGKNKFQNEQSAFEELKSEMIKDGINYYFHFSNENKAVGHKTAHQFDTSLLPRVSIGDLTVYEIRDALR